MKEPWYIIGIFILLSKKYWYVQQFEITIVRVKRARTWNPVWGYRKLIPKVQNQKEAYAIGNWPYLSKMALNMK